MQRALKQNILQDLESDVESRWQQALPYYLNREAVVFVSYCRFWERHGFVQQSLSYTLAKAGVNVVWLDGMGWKKYHPVVRDGLPNLKVVQLPAYPGRRFSWIQNKSITRSSRFIKRTLREAGRDALLWVQGGIEEAICEQLPKIDVFSVFDDPYRHSPVGVLCEKAQLIISQNDFANKTLSNVHPEKCIRLLPPMEVGSQVYTKSSTRSFPENFPERKMGYIGSFSPKSFDLILFEDFVRSFPDWGFVLMGRTEGNGMEFVHRLQTYPNFIYFPWAERDTLAEVWSQLDLSLLFYRRYPGQDGAFPTKALESLHFGVPCIGTQVPKNQELGSFFPVSSIGNELKRMAPKVAEQPHQNWDAAYRYFASEMNPKLHLAAAAERLQALSQDS